MTNKLTLNGFEFENLFSSGGLRALDATFLTFLQNHHQQLAQDLDAYRADIAHFSPTALSEFLIQLAKVLQLFIIDLFQIDDAVAISEIKTTQENPISDFKKYFILRRAKKELRLIETFPSYVELDNWLQIELKNAPITANDIELAIALLGVGWLQNAAENADNINRLVQWCAHVLNDRTHAAHTWTSFQLPIRLDYQQLIPTISDQTQAFPVLELSSDQLRQRDGFKLTDPRMSARAAQDEVNYCIYCHDHDGDFCSKGFPQKKGDPSQGFKKNLLDLTLTGCPLEEKISEMHALKKIGQTIAALAMVMVDNPMCPATGHRICNDCMKACIYQKQTPVNIPQIETRVLTDVLDLPWGVEIYDLLTRWNPLRQSQWRMQAYNGAKVLIAGMGPAGFTLAHHLLLEGCAVVGFDGLKIEPLPSELYAPIKHFSDLYEALDERIMAGFGGVAEYGITVRWDKNFLKLIYLSLMRKPHFQVYGNVRFGGTLRVEDAWKLGFDHFVIAVGAGLPKALSIPGSMAPGMRQANDFLMALQLGNAAKASSLTNLQLRLPAIVIGGGLTGVDTATEAQAYYIKQVEKIYARYQILKNIDEEQLMAEFAIADREILQEFLAHGSAVLAERTRATHLNRAPDFLSLIHAWGGVTIVYRRTMQESPAYINNHEELHKALEEGIFYRENLEPIGVKLDANGYALALDCKPTVFPAVVETEHVTINARSILVATGTQPNIAYEFEHKGTFARLKWQYQHYDLVADHLETPAAATDCKTTAFGPFTSYEKDAHRVTLIGDTHPVFHGNVVKAIASGMRTYPKIMQLLNANPQKNTADYVDFNNKLSSHFRAEVLAIKRLSPKVLELTVSAPAAAHHYRAGQFYRLQNFESLAPRFHQTLLQMEPLALTVANQNANGHLTFLIREQSATAKLAATLKIGEPVALMGPTGVHAKIPTIPETVLMITNENGFAFVTSVGNAMRRAGSRVIVIAQINHQDEIYYVEQLTQAADEIIWQCAPGIQIKKLRNGDTITDESNLFHLLHLHIETLRNIDRLFLLVDAGQLKEFQALRKSLYKDYFLKQPEMIARVYGNMQCMLKGVCAQCLQWQLDPETNLRTKAVFACSWQDQPLELIDIDHILERQAANTVIEKINSAWVDHIFAQSNVPRV